MAMEFHGILHKVLIVEALLLILIAKVELTLLDNYACWAAKMFATIDMLAAVCWSSLVLAGC